MNPLLPAMFQIAALASAAPPQAAQDAPPAVVEEGYQAQLQRGRAMATSGDPAQREQAVSLYTQMLERSPGNSDVLLARGRTYAWMGRYPEAEADIRAVLDASPSYVDAWSALGDVYLWSDRPDDAAAAYTHWMELRPDDPQAALARGRAQRAAGNLDAARAGFAAAGVRGADAAEVERLQSSLQPRIATPESLINADFRWSLRAGIAATDFTGGRSRWIDSELALRRKFSRGSLGVEWVNADRFSQNDSAWALDGYASLWSRAYGNLRFQQGPDGGILPHQSWHAEVFQGVGSGWELSASVDRLRFSSTTEFYGIGVGRYTGNWYLRYKLQHVPGVGSGSWSHRVLARDYYHGDADDYFEVSAGSGRSSDLDRIGGTVHQSNASLGVAWVHYFNPRWGMKLGAGYANDADGFDEREVSVALYTRW